ncbi:MAG: Transposase IS200 like protein [candidate division WS6 bacterium OLB20]|uniref:Transposase IS200 like protein n=1 Tax=candidate division WS6 bacterium OLB20 TaxID=1617426 RepID=A0A136LYJ9_9BACT|nr:MAG: Transposase IS200 like protein [candidate division WS6 bacterium OLB20]
MSKRGLYPGCLVHVFNRGSKKELIFFAASDYRRFISKAAIYAAEANVQIIHYCLLPNHFHFLLRIPDEVSLTKMMQRLTIGHSRYIMYRYGYVGRIFQGRYKSVVVDSSSQLMILSRYIHRNPTEYFGSRDAFKNYDWSSYQEFISGNSDLISSRESVLGLFTDVDSYSAFVEADEVIVQHELKTQSVVIRSLDGVD